MQNQNASDAITMGYDNTDGLLDDSFSISVKQSPSWVEINNGNGDLSDGQGATVSVTISAEDLDGGIYSGYLFSSFSFFCIHGSSLSNESLISSETSEPFFISTGSSDSDSGTGETGFPPPGDGSD